MGACHRLTRTLISVFPLKRVAWHIFIATAVAVLLERACIEESNRPDSKDLLCAPTMKGYAPATSR